MNNIHAIQIGDPWPPRSGWFKDRNSRRNHFYRFNPPEGYILIAADWNEQDVPRNANYDHLAIVQATAVERRARQLSRIEFTPICRRHIDHPPRLLTQPYHWQGNCLNCERAIARGK